MEEKIKEIEPTPESANVESIPAPATRQKNKVTHLLKEMWPAYLVEVFVIILGISITLALEEWRDTAKEKHLEQIYLQNLLADIRLDIRSLKDLSASTQKILDRGNKLLSFSKNPADKDFTYENVNADVRDILARPKFISNDVTFSDLKNSGNLHLIRDIQLKNLLFAYYSQTQNIKDDQEAEQLATITISGDYFLKLFPLYDLEDQPHGSGTSTGLLKSNAATDRLNGANLSDLSKSVEFGNNVLLRVTNRKELLDLYQKADSLATRLEQALIIKSGN
jgi:hypothetical protein